MKQKTESENVFIHRAGAVLFSIPPLSFARAVVRVKGLRDP